MEETFRPDHGADILGVLDHFHFAKFFTICRNPIQQFTATFAATLYPTAFPMIEVEPSHTILQPQRPETGRSSIIGRTKQPPQNRQHRHTDRVEESLEQHGFLE